MGNHLWSSDYYAGNYRNTLTGMPMLKNKYLLGLNYYYNKNLKLQFNWEYNPVDSDERHKFIFQLQTDFDLKI